MRWLPRARVLLTLLAGSEPADPLTLSSAGWHTARKASGVNGGLRGVQREGVARARAACAREQGAQGTGLG
jgi:hypothetical protein